MNKLFLGSIATATAWFTIPIIGLKLYETPILYFTFSIWAVVFMYILKFGITKFDLKEKEDEEINEEFE